MSLAKKRFIGGAIQRDAADKANKTDYSQKVFRSGFISPRNFNNGMSLRGPVSCFRKKATGTRQSLSTKTRLLPSRLAVAGQQRGRNDIMVKEVTDTYETTK